MFGLFADAVQHAACCLCIYIWTKTNVFIVYIYPLTVVNAKVYEKISKGILLIYIRNPLPLSIGERAIQNVRIINRLNDQTKEVPYLWIDALILSLSRTLSVYGSQWSTW